MYARRLSLLAIALLLSACSSPGETKEKVTLSDIVGNWRESTGAQISLAADHTFTSQGLRFDASLVQGCPAERGHGNWGFYIDAGAPGGLVGTSDEATTGDTIGVTFSDIPQGECGITLSVLKDGKLCASMDLDEVCSFKYRFTKQ